MESNASLISSCDGLDGLLGVENFNTELAEGVMLLTPFAADADDEWRCTSWNDAGGGACDISCWAGGTASTAGTGRLDLCMWTEESGKILFQLWKTGTENRVDL